MIGFYVCAEIQDTQTGSSQVDTVNFSGSYLPDGTWSHWSESESGTWTLFPANASGFSGITQSGRGEILDMIHSHAGTVFF